MLCGDCLPLKEVLAVCFSEGTRRRGTGIGGGMSSTVREEGGFHIMVMCMLPMCSVPLPLTSTGDFVAGVAELAVRVL